MGAQVDLKQYSAAIHVHSTFSNGHYEIPELARFALERNIDVLVLTDSFLTNVTYGIWPFDRIGFEGVNRMVRPGVRDHGVKNYFATVAEAQRQFPELIVIPGLEVTPYYYWKGAPWNELTLHDFDRHLMVLGLTEPEIENLPVIGNETWDNTAKDWTLVAFPMGIFFLAVVLLFVKRTRKVRLRYYTLEGKQRRWGLAVTVMLLSWLLAWNNYPFGRLSDPYSGQHHSLAYQNLIDYVDEVGGVLYWSYPEARYRDVEVGRARMVSQPHPEDLLQTDGYHGFEGIYGDRIQVTLPGQTWDLALTGYLEDKRTNPPFVTTGIDFHYFREQAGWYELDRGQTVLLMGEKSEEEVLEALRGGRLYATFQNPKEKLRLYDFSVEIADGTRAIQGSTAVGQSPVTVRVHLDWLQQAPEMNEAFQVELIRNGEVVEKIDQPLPIQMISEQQLPAGRYYFRVRAVAGGYQVLSNPVFVTVN